METEQLHLKWSSQHSDLIQTFDHLLSTETMVDVTLVCEGYILKAHKLILSACSSLFQNLFIENPSQHPIVILQNIKYSDLKVLINFIYKGEICISRDQLTILFKTAELLKIKGLLDIKELYESSNSALRVTKNNFAGSSYNVTEAEHNNEFPSSIYKNEQSRKRNLSYNPENSDGTSSKRKSVCPLKSQSISSVANESINKCQVPNSEETDFNLAIVKDEINSEEIIIPDRTVDEEILNEKKKNDNECSTPVDVKPLLIPISSEINENSKIDNNKPTSIENKQLFVYYAPSRCSLPLSLPENHSGANSTVTNEISMNFSTPSTSYDENLYSKDSEVSLSGSSNSQFDKDINTLTEEEYKVTEEKSKFMCKICKREFSCQNSLNIHMKIHKNEAPFTCDICRVKFRWRQVFLKHMKRHSGVEPFKCDICTYSCKESEDMLNHIRHHVGDNVLICDICFRRYKNENDLKRHSEIHNRKKMNDNECSTPVDVIPLMIPISSEINENSKIENNKPTSIGNKQLFVYYAPSRCSLPLSLPENHSGANSTVTNEISMNFSTPSTSYDENLSSKDSEISMPGSSNSQFDKDINTLTEEEYKVTEEKSKFMCEICKRECNCQKSLNIHMKIHKKESPFTCDICQVKFKWRQVFLKHMKKHSGVEPFKCDICTYSCKEREDMLNHIRHHVGDDVLICDICFRRYKNKNDLKRHSEIHNRKVKSFYCDICEAQFSHKRTLDKHMISHETKEPLTCEICNTIYSNKRSLNRHRLSHENI